MDLKDKWFVSHMSNSSYFILYILKNSNAEKNLKSSY